MLITMRHEMKNRYRVFRRGWGTFYCEDLVTKKQESLKTRDKDEAYRLVAAKNETEEYERQRKMFAEGKVAEPVAKTVNA